MAGMHDVLENYLGEVKKRQKKIKLKERKRGKV